MEENQYKHTYPAIEYLREDLNNMTFNLNQKKRQRKEGSYLVYLMQNKRTQKK